MRLSIALLLVALACGSDADRAARRADVLLRRDGETYRRLCQTRLRDGYVITYRLVPKPNIEYADIEPWPIVVVPDSGALWIADEKFTTDTIRQIDDPTRPPVRTAPLDSVDAVRSARVTAGPAARLHCYISLPRAGSAFVQMLDSASSAKGPVLGGVTVGVDGGDPARGSRFDART